MNDVKNIFKIKNTVDTLKTPERQSIEQTEDYAVKKDIQAISLTTNNIVAQRIDMIEDAFGFSYIAVPFTMFMVCDSNNNTITFMDMLVLNADTSVLKINNIQEYVDNASAILNGLTVGAIYRTGDLLKIVH